MVTSLDESSLDPDDSRDGSAVASILSTDAASPDPSFVKFSATFGLWKFSLFFDVISITGSQNESNSGSLLKRIVYHDRDKSKFAIFVEPRSLKDRNLLRLKMTRNWNQNLLQKNLCRILRKNYLHLLYLQSRWLLFGRFQYWPRVSNKLWVIFITLSSREESWPK